MSLRVWSGFIAVSLVCVMFYTGFIPVWDVIISLAMTHGVSDSYIRLLDRVLYWSPFIVMIAALIHAVLSPAFRRRATWR